MKLQSDLREFIELLNSRRVEYLIVGGHAVAFHGYARMTGDIDFLIRPSAENAILLLAVLSDFGFGSLELFPQDFTQPSKVLQLGRVPNRIDLLTSISGVDFEEAWKGRVSGALDGLPVNFLGKDSLIKNKRASGRPRDLADLDYLDDEGGKTV